MLSYFSIGKNGSSYKKRCLYSANIPYMQGNMLEILNRKLPKSIEPSKFLGCLETELLEHFIIEFHNY